MSYQNSLTVIERLYDGLLKPLTNLFTHIIWKNKPLTWGSLVKLKEVLEPGSVRIRVKER